MDVTNQYNFTWFGDIHGPKPYKFIGFRWAFISQTPVAGGAAWQRPHCDKAHLPGTGRAMKVDPVWKQIMGKIKLGFKS